MNRIPVAIALAATLLSACKDRELLLPTSPEPRHLNAAANARPEGAGGHADISFEFGTTVVDQFSFTARNTRNGTHGQFEFRAKYEGLVVRAHGRVDCITVTGNKARVGGTVTQSTFEEGIPSGSQLTWSITDNGEPGAGSDTSSPLLGAPAEAYCAGGVPYPEYPIVRGNLQVQ